MCVCVSVCVCMLYIKIHLLSPHRIFMVFLPFIEQISNISRLSTIQLAIVNDTACSCEVGTETLCGIGMKMPGNDGMYPFFLLD